MSKFELILSLRMLQFSAESNLILQINNHYSSQQSHRNKIFTEKPPNQREIYQQQVISEILYLNREVIKLHKL